MKKLNKVAMLFAAAAFAVPMAASAQNVQPFPAKPIASPRPKSSSTPTVQISGARRRPARG